LLLLHHCNAASHDPQLLPLLDTPMNHSSARFHSRTLNTSKGRGGAPRPLQQGEEEKR